MSQKIRFSFIVALFGAVAAVGSPAVAADGAGPLPMLVVATRGVDLATPVGQAVMRHRVEVASGQVCREAGQAPGSEGFRSCFASVVQDTWATMQVQIADARHTMLATAKP